MGVRESWKSIVELGRRSGGACCGQPMTIDGQGADHQLHSKILVHDGKACIWELVPVSA
jgi:hypothetical protein